MYIGLSNFILSFRFSIAIRFSEKTLLLWKFSFAIITSIYFSSQRVTSRTLTWLHTFSMVLPKITLFINLNKFFSKSFFAKVLKFVLSWMYSRSYGDCANCSIRWIFIMRKSWRVRADCDVWRNAFYHTIAISNVARSFSSRFSGGFLRVGQNDRSESASWRYCRYSKSTVTCRWIYCDGRDVKIVYVVERKSVYGNSWYIAQPYRLLSSKYIMYIDSFDGPYDCMYLLLACACLFEHWLRPPRIPRSMNRTSVPMENCCHTFTACV